MNVETVDRLRTVGETAAVEFKRCGNGIESDVYETVCSFLNRFGGDLFLGIADDGTVVGVPEKAAPDLVKNFIKNVSNPNMFSPTVYLVPEMIQYDKKRTILHIHVPPSAEVHSYKRVIYDRVDDADVKVTATGAIAQMYIRKQSVFTERRIFPYAQLSDLRLDLLPVVRRMAANQAGGFHPWNTMDDETLLRSAGLIGVDMSTGERGLNLAAIMLLGREDVIQNVAPAYVTDAIVRRVNLDRYDDRLIVKSNLIESYDQLFQFGCKHLPDKFFLEGTVSRSIRNIILREMIANTLIHREFTSSYTAKMIIEKERIRVENANRAASVGMITPENLEPNPKNPIIAAFFRNIGYADQLGSGVRNLFTYSLKYSGKEPVFAEDDVFKIIVPIDDEYLPQSRLEREAGGNEKIIDGNNGGNENVIGGNDGGNETGLSEMEQLLSILERSPTITQKEISQRMQQSLRSIQRMMKELQESGRLERAGSSRTGKWVVVCHDDHAVSQNDK